MGVNENMAPGGDSLHTALQRLGRAAGAGQVRDSKFGGVKGLTLTPVSLRGILFQTSGSYKKLDFNDIGLIVDIVGLGGANGLEFVFSDALADDLDAAHDAADAIAMILHKGILYCKRAEDKLETAQKHVIVNGSFELFSGGEPVFWARKP